MAIQQAAAAILRARQHQARLQADQARLQAELVKYYTEDQIQAIKERRLTQEEIFAILDRIDQALSLSLSKRKLHFRKNGATVAMAEEVSYHLSL